MSTWHFKYTIVWIQFQAISLYKVKLVNKSLEFHTLNLWACTIPKNKIGVFVLADNFTQLILSYTKVL